MDIEAIARDCLGTLLQIHRARRPYARLLDRRIWRYHSIFQGHAGPAQALNGRAGRMERQKFRQGMEMTSNKRQVVLQVLGEGGELTLIGDKTPKGWVFTLAIVDQTLAYIEEGGEISGIRGTASTWRGALKLLDIYPWHMLSAAHVHPDFAERTLRAASARLAKEKSSHAGNRLRRWQEKCRQ